MRMLDVGDFGMPAKAADVRLTYLLFFFLL